MRCDRRAFIKLGSDGVHNHCCNGSHILIPPTRSPCFQHFEPLQMATSTNTVAGTSQNPSNTRRRPGRQPVSCAECRRSAFPPHPASCLPTFLTRPRLGQAEAQVRSQGNRHRISCGWSISVPFSDVVGSRFLARLVGNEDVPRCAPPVSVHCSVQDDI